MSNDDAGAQQSDAKRMIRWRQQLTAQVPRQDIPKFLQELQAMVAALRDDRPWRPLITPYLRRYPELVAGYLRRGPVRDALESALRAP